MRRGEGVRDGVRGGVREGLRWAVVLAGLSGWVIGGRPAVLRGALLDA